MSDADKVTAHVIDSSVVNRKHTEMLTVIYVRKDKHNGKEGKGARTEQER